MKRIADALLEYETLTKEQIDSLVETGKMPEEIGKEVDHELEKLKALAKEKGIKGYTKITKEELEEAVNK